ncbi:major facilitator superfamily domain-containing protein [Aspergillus ambiguus]|uniref:major facilitator superfamily domain-containing protein n=1 Tax=Aspergillus ambiguus TaxID=176160 RepID=UPI003CCC8F2B
MFHNSLLPDASPTGSQNGMEILSHSLISRFSNDMDAEKTTIVSFSPGDPDNPHNWSKARKLFVIATCTITTMNVTYGVTVPSGATPKIAQEFNIHDHEVLVLIVSLFIIGYVLGPFLWGPLTEAYGRRWPLMIAFIFYTVLILGSSLSPSYPVFLVFRLLSGMAGIAPMVSGFSVCSDLEPDITARGRLSAFLTTVGNAGPAFGPFLGGFIGIAGWRWCFRFVLISSGVVLPMAIFMPETCAPVILKRRAAKMRKETGNMNIVSPADLNQQSFLNKLAVNFSRPFQMLFSEPIVYCSAAYIALTFAICFVYLQAYPIIFRGIYDFDYTYTGICFLPILLGIIISHFIFLWYDGFLSRAKARKASWASIEEFHRLPLACVGGPLYVVSLFWIGWTAHPSIHPAVPALSGIPFGIGFNINFLGMLNYINDAYGVYSASAIAAVTSCRCLAAAVLPLAVKPMFDRLGASWSCSLLAFVTLLASLIPFVFIHNGSRIRAHSKFCRELQQTGIHGKAADSSSGSSGEVSVVSSETEDV